MKKISIINTAIVCSALMLASCGVKKAIVNESPKTPVVVTDNTASLAVRKLTYVQKVSDNQVYTKNIVGNMTFTIKYGDKDITVPGAVHMRKDEVIRLQLFIPLLGSEVGRLEFTPDYVLVVDRLHKEYIKSDYSQLDFLKENGLNFYSLQSLFWNQLILPGVQTVSESDLKKFDVNLDATGSTLPVTLKNGNMKYQWSADKSTGRIVRTDVTYNSAAHGASALRWNYDDFKSVGVKMFPAKQSFNFTTTATKQKQTVDVTIEMNDVKTDSDWDTKTSVSDKYKKVEAQDVFGKLLNM
jgi:hypothetical protein